MSTSVYGLKEVSTIFGIVPGYVMIVILSGLTHKLIKDNKLMLFKKNPDFNLQKAQDFINLARDTAIGLGILNNNGIKIRFPYKDSIGNPLTELSLI